MKYFFQKTMLLIFIISSCTILSGKQKDTLEVVLYETSEDFRLRKSMDINALLITDEHSEHYFMVSKVIHKHNMKKVADAKFIFAMKVGESFYVNMGYNDDNYYEDMFARLNVVGDKICTIGNVDVGSNGHSAAVLGGAVGGAVGSLLGSIIDIRSNKNFGIYYIDLTENEYRNFSRKRNESCLIKGMDRSSFKKLCKKYKVEIIEKPLIEEVYQTVDKINKG